MRNRPNYWISRLLLADVCGAGAATTQAAAGSNITPEQLSEVRQGMSRDDVLQALGRPAIRLRYGNEPGPTWVYRLLSFGNRYVHVDFGVDGMVAATSKRLDYSGDTAK